MSTSFTLELITEKSVNEIVAFVGGEVQRRRDDVTDFWFGRLSCSAWTVDQESDTDEFAGGATVWISAESLEYFTTVMISGTVSRGDEAFWADMEEIGRLATLLRWGLRGSGLVYVGNCELVWRGLETWIDPSADTGIGPAVASGGPKLDGDVVSEAEIRG